MSLFPSLSHPWLLAPLALAIEAVIGYPPRLFAAIGHPVTWIGSLIAWTDRNFNRLHDSFATRRLAGFLILTALLFFVFLVASFVQDLLLHGGMPFVIGFPLLALCASSLLAQRSLHDHVQAVGDALANEGIEAGRSAVARIVGRDVTQLDEAGILRAAVESLAENFSDGIVAPAFWLALGGLPGLCLYKTINTADSMIGHRTERHEAFGFSAAKLDDVVNWPAARLAALWLCGAAALLSYTSPELSARRAFAITRRDARGHPSPNAGWPEAAMAGALGRRLGGPRAYAGTIIEDKWIGDGMAPMTQTDLGRALTLYRLACFLNGAGLTLLCLVIALA
ncbi:adenosylcobinamide-phosphate synthase CbiB [Beijerinckia indica]|uniref:Cobalamin biosynthesis protein CobD n=1 Tax=Beijerinckia indica subsp. indica (strain ATCC 9039 / DSM 1715 / NCIMB 8712) TaxID=395963 RepID=B2IE17_BEII9|nr:adenosylcobinamide-phosphate synthase CbiB [Beijerinckia indica]ACB94041.1 cobalamin biosynthesis protein CobD [Beijerinckia indica subsp. indica ATCC 9039]